MPQGQSWEKRKKKKIKIIKTIMIIKKEGPMVFPTFCMLYCMCRKQREDRVKKREQQKKIGGISVEQWREFSETTGKIDKASKTRNAD